MDRTRPPTLSPLQAQDAIDRFAAQRGTATLRLAMHAALPQSLRVDLLHALRLNFAAETLGDTAIEADVLFAPFCRALGNACWEIDGEVRMQLLRALDPAHAEDQPPRSMQVADCVLAWLDRERRRARADSDIVYRTWIEVERWNALAFADPDATAEQLAAAVTQAAVAGAPAARLRVGTLAAALATPLPGYRRLLAYAKGVEALNRGEIERARQLLDHVGDRTIKVGAQAIEPGVAMLRVKTRSRRDATRTDAPPATAARAPKVAVIVHATIDDDWSRRLRLRIEALAGQDDVDVRQVNELTVGKLSPDTPFDGLLADAHAVVVLLSPHYVESGALARLDERLLKLHRRGALRVLWTCVRSCVWQRTPYAGLQWVHSANEPLADMKAVDAGRQLEQIALAVGRVWMSPPVVSADNVPQVAAGRGVYVSCLGKSAHQDGQRVVRALRERDLTVYDGVDTFADISLEAAAAGCAVMLTLIGDWQPDATTSEPGLSAQALAAALTRDTATVVPVLVDNTPMPRWSELPDSLKPLLSLQAMPLRRRAQWNDDLRQVLARVQDSLAATAQAGAAPPRRALLLIDNERHRGLAEALSAALRRAECEPVIPNSELDNVSAHSKIVAALLGVDLLVLDLSLPEGRLVAWASGVAEAQVPLVPIQGPDQPSRDAWAAHLLEPQRAAWVAPTVNLGPPGDLEDRVATDILHAAVAVNARAKRAPAPGVTPESADAEAGLNIALCSTVADLAPFRDAVVEVAARWGDHVTSVDIAHALSPLKLELASIAECHVAVFIVAWRYGYVPSDPQLNPQGLSTVELQYQEARRLDKSRLVLLVEDVKDWPAQWRDADERLVLFRRELARDPAMRPIRDVEQLRESLAGFLAVRTHRPIQAPPRAVFRSRGDRDGPAEAASASPTHRHFPMLPIDPPEEMVSWDDLIRLVPLRSPRSSFFDKLERSEEINAAHPIEALTNERLRAEVGDLSLVPIHERIVGPHAFVAMSAFTHLNLFGSRLSDGKSGVLYLASDVETAVDEASHHLGAFLRSTNQGSLDVEWRAYAMRVHANLLDLRPLEPASNGVLDRNSYVVGQQFGQLAREKGADGVMYRTVRGNAGGTVVALFRPNVVSDIRVIGQVRRLWDGERFTEWTMQDDPGSDPDSDSEGLGESSA